MTVQPAGSEYPARLTIDYLEQHDRARTFLRVFMVLPIGIVLAVLTAGATQTVYDRSGEVVRHSSGGITAGLFVAALLVIVVRQRYPRWWFDFALEIDYPDVERDLNRWLPLVKWLFAIPHLIVLSALSVAAFFAVVVAWFAILFTGRYPRGLFDFGVGVGVGRWWLRVQAYATLLVTTVIRPSPSSDPGSVSSSGRHSLPGEVSPTWQLEVLTSGDHLPYPQGRGGMGSLWCQRDFQTVAKG